MMKRKPYPLGCGFCLAVGGGSLKKIVVVLVYFTSVFLGKNLC